MENSHVIQMFLVFLAGFLGSFLNILSGGGSVITIGILIFLGLDGALANGTIRIGVLVGTLSAACKIKQENLIDIKDGVKYGLCAVPGALFGAFYAVKIQNELFHKILSVILIMILISLFIPQRKLKDHSEFKKKLVYPALFLVGFYGGFIQIGIGFLLISIFRHLLNVDLLKVTGYKVFVVLIYTIPVVIFFGFKDKIHWEYAICLALGKFFGGWLSIKLAVKEGEKFIRLFLIISIFIMFLKLIFL